MRSAEDRGMLEPIVGLAALAPARDALRDCPVPWAIAGGWAIDLAFGVVTRPHADVDIAAMRVDQAALRAHLAEWRWECVEGGVVRAWEPGEWLALPTHELYATAPGGASRLEILLNEREGDDWVYRRDARVRMPLARAWRETAAGVPALAPEVALLFKARAPRATDEADFAFAAPRLSAESRAWLGDALEVTLPRHPWQATLASNAWR